MVMSTMSIMSTGMSTATRLRWNWREGAVLCRFHAAAGTTARSMRTLTAMAVPVHAGGRWPLR
jgi:hypothetical protein